jgi:hypothetical protein
MTDLRLPRRPGARVAALAAVVVVLAIVVGGCAGAGASSTPATLPTPSVGPVTTPEEAVARVIATEPRLTGIKARDPDLIGQGSWYEVVPASGVGAFLVTVQIGWGDCPAGCINGHSWTYAVGPDGTVTLQSEGGDPVPADAWPSPGGSGRTGIFISATSGPSCPVERPGDPACAPNPVAGAEVLVLDAAGSEVARAETGADGTAFVEVPAGGYVVEPAPVEGMMGTPEPVSATVVDGVGTPVELAYDTGVR